MVQVLVVNACKKYGKIEALKDVSLKFSSGDMTAILGPNRCRKTTLPVYMYTASIGYELQVASVTALVFMVPGAILLLLLERFLKAEYLAFLGQL
jgi:ABC-type phosphate transport system ATPase subunit